MDIVCVFDSERRFVTVNEAACVHHNATREQLIGHKLDEFIGAERAQADWKDFLTPERIALGMQHNVWEGEDDGRRVVVEVRATPHYVPDRHLFVLRDITEQRALEEQLRQAQKMEAVGQLAGGIAHDFNNLLTVITGFGELVEAGLEEAAPQREAMQHILKASESAATLTRQLLTFSRQQISSPQVIDLNDVVTNFGAMLGRVIGEDIAFRIAPAPDLG